MGPSTLCVWTIGLGVWVSVLGCGGLHVVLALGSRFHFLRAAPQCQAFTLRSLIALALV